MHINVYASYRYAKFIVGYPYANIIIMCILFIWAAVIGFVPQLGAQKLPDFSKPTKVLNAHQWCFITNIIMVFIIIRNKLNR